MRPGWLEQDNTLYSGRERGREGEREEGREGEREGEREGVGGRERGSGRESKEKERREVKIGKRMTETLIIRLIKELPLSRPLYTHLSQVIKHDEVFLLYKVIILIRSLLQVLYEGGNETIRVGSQLL